MATDLAHRSVGHIARYGPVETGTDTVTETTPPPPCPLREAVLSRFSGPVTAAGDEQRLELDELLGYLRRIDPSEQRPLAAVAAQADALSDPAVPSPEQAALLEWVGEAFEFWRKNYPLEPPLASQLLKMQPLAAALAITEPQFLLPGQHGFHELMDSIHAYAIGWQPSLGRAGNTLEKQVTAAIENASRWFQDRSTDLTAICAGLNATAERDLSRAQRMSQRMMDTEQGRLRAADAKHTAAGMINDILSQLEAPVSVGEFLKGPWYESAQLVLLKFGADSEQWQQMTGATEVLVDSMQVEGPQGDKRRQYLFEAVTRIPKDLKRWLLSLQHDSDAANEAVQPIEACHLRILRELPLEVEYIELLELSGEEPVAEGAITQDIEQLTPGQWFRIENPPEPPIRAHLALKLEKERQLLFANQSGIKALQLDYAAFHQLLESKKAVPLRQGLSFSRSLARAAGIESDEELARLVSTARELAIKHEEQLAREAQERERQRREAEEQARQAKEAAERERREAEEQARIAREAEEQARREAAEREQKAQEAAALAAAEAAKNLSLRDEAALLAERANTVDANGSSPDTLENGPEKHPTENQPAGDSAAGATGADPKPSITLNLPMGAWLGFHDGEAPLMAKLAVHDPELDLYIFVNRQGIKMRQLSRRELESLAEQELVDILTTNSNFRADVGRARDSDQ